MKLYGFFRSGTSHRLRIALNLKGLTYDQVAIDLRTEQHLGAAYKAINPQQLVPALDIDGTVLTQSPAIIEWPRTMTFFGEIPKDGWRARRRCRCVRVAPLVLGP